MSDQPPIQAPPTTAAAEQLARLTDAIYLELAPSAGFVAEPPRTSFDDLHPDVQKLRIDVAAKLIAEGWTSPEKFSKCENEQRELLDLYFDACKAVGVDPTDDFKSLPFKARGVAKQATHFKNLAATRLIELIRIRQSWADSTGNLTLMGTGNFPSDDRTAIPESRIDFSDILNFASGELYDAAKGYQEAEKLEISTRAHDAAQALLEIKVILENPMKLIQGLAIDRDLWQAHAEGLTENAAITELALGQTQEALIDLTRGHDKMIRLLERFARLHVRSVMMNWKDADDDYEKLDNDVKAVLNSGQVRVIEL